MAEPAGAGPSGGGNTSDQQATGQNQLPKPKQIGRPPHEIWRWFRKVGTAHKSSNLAPAVCFYAPPGQEAHHTIRTSTVDNLIKHLVDCPAAPADARERASQLLAERTEAAAAPSKKRRQHQQPKAGPAAHTLVGPQHPHEGVGQQGHGEMTPALAREINAKLLRWMESAGITVAQTDTPEFVDLCRTLHPAYFPGASMVPNIIAPREAARHECALAAKRAAAHAPPQPYMGLGTAQEIVDWRSLLG